MDPFASVFGTERGKLLGDTLLSKRPTEAGREDLEQYLIEMRERRFAPTVNLLSAHKQILEDRPLLKQLAGEMCRLSVASSALQFDDAVRHYLSETRVYTKDSDFLVVSNDLSKPLKSAGKRDKSQRVIHIWPEGDNVGPLSCMSKPGETVCGLRIERAAWMRAERGAWHSDNLKLANWSTCDKCQQGCPEELSYVMNETPAYIPFGNKLYTKLIKHITLRMLSELKSNEFASIEELRAIADATYRRLVLPASVSYAMQSKESVMQWLLGSRDWRKLAGQHQGALHPLLTKEDWSKALAYCVPKTTKEGTVSQASQEDFEKSRAYLVAVVERKVNAASASTVMPPPATG